jgi:hypothetical protein
MPIDTHRTVTPQLVIGAFVALLGVILLLDRLDLVEARHLRLIWPIVLMAVGGSLLAQRSDSSGRFWGAAWTLVGVWMLFSMLGWIQVSIWQLIAPLVLIAVGTTVIMRAIGQETSWPHRRGARSPLPFGASGTGSSRCSRSWARPSARAATTRSAAAR